MFERVKCDVDADKNLHLERLPYRTTTK